MKVCPCCGYRDQPTLPFQFSPVMRTITRHDTTVELPPRHALIVEALCKTYPAPIHFDRIYPHVWPEDNDIDENSALKIYIVGLRKKLAPIGMTVVSKWGFGYALALKDKP